MLNHNVPLWSPRFRTNETTGDLEYKPFPAYPTWLIAWEAISGGGGGGGVTPVTWQGFALALRYTVGAPVVEVDLTQWTSFIMFAETDTATWEQDITIVPHELGHFVTCVGAHNEDCGILELFLDADSLGIYDFYSIVHVENANPIWFIPVELVTEARTAVLKGVVTGKNVGSSGYKCPLTYLVVRPAYELA
jgi:hypothetical protein